MSGEPAVRSRVSGLHLNQSLDQSLRMTHFITIPSDVSRQDEAAIRRAAREAIGMLSAAGRIDVEHSVAAAIVGAVRAGCVRHGELVALGLASGRNQTREAT